VVAATAPIPKRANLNMIVEFVIGCLLTFNSGESGNLGMSNEATFLIGRPHGTPPVVDPG